MMNEINRVRARPFAGELRHHQLGATDAVSDPMLDIETNLHLVMPLSPAG